MRLGIQAGFGQLIGDVLHDLRTRGCQLVRIDCQENRDPALAEEVIDAGMQPLAIVRVPEQIVDLPDGSFVEFGNEPDQERFGWVRYNRLERLAGDSTSPWVMRNVPLMIRTSYWHAALRAIPIAEARGLPLMVGSVSNLTSRGLRFLRSGPWHEIPSWVVCSLHRYPTPQGPEDAHLRGWTRDDEIAEVRRIVGQRPLAVTEIGYHMGPGGWTEDESAAHMAWERAFFTRHDFSDAIAYQLNSGPADSTNHNDHYGFRRADLSWRDGLVAAWFAQESTEHVSTHHG